MQPSTITSFDIFSCNWPKVVYPLTFCWLSLFLCLISWFQYRGKKLCRKYRYLKWIDGIPESCLLMVVGILMGWTMPAMWFDMHFPKVNESIFKVVLDPHIFFTAGVAHDRVII